MSPQPTLTNLPPELRLQIYSLVLGPPKPLLLSPHSRQNSWATPPLCRSSRQLRQETLPLYFGLHDFTYDLRSPLDTGLTQLERVLRALEPEGLRLRSLRLKHVSRGVLSTAELQAWVRVLALYRRVVPPVDAVTFCQGPLRYRAFAAQVAVALRQLARFAVVGVNEGIFGSGEEGVLGLWAVEQLERKPEGRAVLGGLRFAEEMVRGFIGAEVEESAWSGAGAWGGIVSSTAPMAAASS